MKALGEAMKALTFRSVFENALKLDGKLVTQKKSKGDAYGITTG